MSELDDLNPASIFVFLFALGIAVSQLDKRKTNSTQFLAGLNLLLADPLSEETAEGTGILMGLLDECTHQAKLREE